MAGISKLRRALNSYLAFTLVYYFFGRYAWNIPNPGQLLCFVLLCYILLNIGILSYIRPRANDLPVAERCAPVFEVYTTKVQSLFRVSAVALIVFQIAWVVTFLGRFGVATVFQTLGSNYYERLSYSGDRIGIMQVRTLLWGLTLFVYPIGVAFFAKMKVADRALLVLAVSVDVLASLNMGVSKNIGDFLIVLLVCNLVRPVRVSAGGILERQRTRKTYTARWLGLALAMAFGVMAFGVIQHLRNLSTGVSSRVWDNPYYRFASIREARPFELLSFGVDSLIPPVDQLGAYVSHGYTGLAFALQLPFRNTYGLGFSRALMEYARDYLNIDVVELTYTSRIDQVFGWPDGMYWPSAFTWFGSAVSIWLVPIVMLGYGRFFGRVAHRVAIRGDVVSLALLSQLAIGVLYLPANAQLFQSRASLWGTTTLLILYFWTGRRLRTSALPR